jgi:hypothetical protein
MHEETLLRKVIRADSDQLLIELMPLRKSIQKERLLEILREEATGMARERGHLLGGWERIDEDTWSARCIHCQWVVHASSRIYGLAGHHLCPHANEEYLLKNS